MLNPVYYIVDAGMLTNVQSGTENVLALKITDEEKGQLQACYKAAETISTPTFFCLYIVVEQPVDELYIFDLVSFFFSPHYYKKGNKPVVLLACKDQKEKETFSVALLQGARKQGFGQLELHLVPLEQKEKVTLYRAIEKASIEKDYVNEQNAFSDKPFYIEAHSATELKEIAEALKSIEVEFALSNKVLYNCKRENRGLVDKLQQTETLLAAAEDEIEAMTSHINRLRSASQAASLQNYYTNEYEVLPRWYKQFGHVLKVLMGKRTFGSLFNDTEKKYKS